MYSFLCSIIFFRIFSTAYRMSSTLYLCLISGVGKNWKNCLLDYMIWLLANQVKPSRQWGSDSLAFSIGMVIRIIEEFFRGTSRNMFIIVLWLNDQTGETISDQVQVSLESNCYMKSMFWNRTGLASLIGFQAVHRSNRPGPKTGPLIFP